MSAELLARSLYLTIVLIVTIAIGGCIPVASFHTGAKSSALEKGKTTRADILEMFDDPDAKTFDGRFFLYTYHKETAWLDLLFGGVGADIYDGRLLIEFDDTNVVEEYSKHKCKAEFPSGDPLCPSLCEMLQQRVEADVASRYCLALVAAEALTQSLHEAAKLGDLEEVGRLIAQDADVDGQAATGGRTPLIVAIAQANPALVELLIAKGASVYTRDASGNPPLIMAIRTGDVALVELLIAKGADVKTKGARDYTPLHWAAKGGHVAIAEILLARGANSNAKALDGTTPLHEAAREGHAVVVESLLAKGAKVNAKTKKGQTALHEAARNGHTAVVQLLIAKGANVNAKDKNRTTPLYVAVEGDYIAVVKLLLTHGANVNAKDKSPFTLLSLAILVDHQELIELLKQHGAK